MAPSFVAQNQAVNKPFVIKLNESLRSVPLDDLSISPKVAGSWRFVSGDLIGDDELAFTPATYFNAGTLYTVTISKPVPRAFFGTVAIPTVQFRTEPAPGLAHSGLAALADNATIAADASFEVSLVAPNNDLRKLELHTTPSVPLKETVRDDEHYTWSLSTGYLPQGQPITVTVTDSRNNVTLLTKTLTVATEPAIATPVQATHFIPGDVATIVFNEPIEASDAADITFSLPGKGTWQNSTTYAFTPTTVSPGQTYSYTLKRGIRSTSGGILAADQAKTFSATGAVQVVSSSPQGSSLPEASEAVSFTFDQPVDHNSAQSRFAISSGTVTGFSWSGDTMTATVTNLGYQHTVTATITAGVTNAAFGLPSTASFTDSFTVAPQIVKYDVPYFRQQYSATCAAASLRMILAYHGISADDMGIVQRMGYNPTVENTSTNPATWDDPQQMFVGAVSGSIQAGVSAGPDAPPVAAAARSYGLNADAVTGINVNWIAQQLYDNHLVVFFGVYHEVNQYETWQTPSGRIEKMNISSHARAIIGVEGSPSNPIGFWVSDPLTGTSFWSASALQTNLDYDAYQQAVDVY